MEHLTVAKFSYGLDTRRSELTSQPGTLEVCENAHISQGGQVEKRKAFVRVAQTQSGYYGLQETSNSLNVFGSTHYASVTRVRTSNVATLTIAAGHIFVVGDTVKITGMTSTGYNSSAAVLTAVNSGAGTISYTNTGADEVATGDTTGLVVLSVRGILTYNTLRHYFSSVDYTALNPGVPTYTEPVLNSIVNTSAFGNKCFAIAHFAAASTGLVFDACTQCFYDSSAVLPNVLGINWVTYPPTSAIFTTLTRAKTGGAATLDIGAHAFGVGNDIVIQGVGGVSYNGVFALTAVTATTISYTCNNTDTEATTSDSGGIVYQVAAITTNKGYMASAFKQAFLQYFPTGFSVVNTNLASVGNINYAYSSVTGPAGANFTVTLSDTSHDATFGNHLGLSPGVAGQDTASTGSTVEVLATCSFFLISGAAGSINTVKTNAGAGTDLLAGTPINYSQSLLITAQNVAAAIVANGGGYFAVATLVSGIIAQVTVTAPPGSGSTVNTQTLQVNSTTIKTASTSSAGGATGNVLSTALIGGVDQSNGTGQLSNFVWGVHIDSALDSQFRVVWARGDIWRADILYNGITYTIGAGNIGGVVPTFCMALGNKLYMIASNSFYFSAIGDATKWEDQDDGAGFIPIKDIYAAPTDLVATAPYQGKLAVFSRRNIQIYSVNADPALYNQSQSLQNIGTLAALSVQALGDFDVLFLADSGVRSLRVRDNTLNAYTVDVGSAIDSLIEAALVTAGSNTVACGIVDPATGRYWLYLKGTIYVLSYFPSLKIMAWSTYLPTSIITQDFTASTIGQPAGTAVYSGLIVGQTYTFTFGDLTQTLTCGSTVLTMSGSFVATATTATRVSSAGPPSVNPVLNGPNSHTFTPVKFVSYNGQVYVLDDVGDVYVYGGTDNNTYDITVATVELPWLDGGNAYCMKQSQRVDVAMAGQWTISLGMDPRAGTLNAVIPPSGLASPDETQDSTYNNGAFPFEGRGSHFKFKAVTAGTWAKAAKMDSFTLQYTKGEEI